MNAMLAMECCSVCSMIGEWKVVYAVYSHECNACHGVLFSVQYDRVEGAVWYTVMNAMPAMECCAV